MTEVSKDCGVGVPAVMTVLADGWLFGLWVVGASHLRAVDAEWPTPGSRIHHAVGIWPLLIHDHTEVLSWDPNGCVELLARGWPIGEARVLLQVHPRGSGSTIVMTERVVRGPGTMLRPLERVMLPPRNRESLSRLVAVAEGRG
jgi:hypothetical protein